MANFIQPQNREADLKAIMENYEDKIGHSDWLTDAFQKDGIQNSWDAKINKSGKDWTCTLFLRGHIIGDDTSHITLGIIDKGTTGLTGTIPESQTDAINALTKEDPNEKLAYFLSSNWSNKAEESLGTRGRGKMVFVGASKDRKFYFDSLRNTDNEYVFGATFLNKDKAIGVEVYKGIEADYKRKEILGENSKRLQNYGTRILIKNPKMDLVRTLLDLSINTYIQNTWWEILCKYKAQIFLDLNNQKKPIEESSWMPITKLDIKECEVFDKPIPLPKFKDLKIKKISVCYIGDKDIPDAYKGISIQRSGMVVERIPTYNIIKENIGEKIIGSVELEKPLEEEIKICEGPEHYSIFWTRTIPQQIRNILKEKILYLTKKYDLVEKGLGKIYKGQHEAQIAIEKELNTLAKSFDFLQGKNIASRERNVEKRQGNQKIRLSLKDFKTPYDSGRVDSGQKIYGTYVVPINETNQSIKVLVKVWLDYAGGIFITGGKFFKIEKEIIIPTEIPCQIGWPQIACDSRFPSGKYAFKAKMVLLEDVVFDTSLKFEKGYEIYGPVSRSFYLNEDPEEKGIFKFQLYPSNDKSKYFWWSLEDKQYVIYYNDKHPLFKESAKDKEKLKLELRKIGIMVLFSLACSDDFNLYEEGQETKIFNKSILSTSNFDDLLQEVIKNLSKHTWK